MSTLATPARNAALDAVNALANGGKLRIKEGSTVLCELDLPVTAFQAASSGSAVARGDDGATAISAENPLTGTGSAAGNANAFDVIASGGSVVQWSGTAGAAAAELILANVSIAEGQPIEITGWTRTQAA
jgi:hypothetical protein